ncbi:UDP-N-acetylmuramate dehydrogenase [Luteipulveratus mongoliensis]|uniref:UDP-N-acetylenolpyruvoylglucosamine reductase n=1 Tax=Luteipulveratus mongoliensis TaxID=571913 RepID=A0A0K1JMN9_9MICO|nr:UDP-N-acetylmuramate dehydrogenase [Luteipulveratus mongoliensis]AKU17848.1 UDP-N-acetylenolpyruvoylglucosamine reductase [Luteipulveratus mongoliensis]
MKESTEAALAPLTTMRVGGPAERLVEVETTDELVDAVREVDDADEPLLILSGGSNVVISDQGFAGSVVRVATSGISVESADDCSGVSVRVAAGEDWDGFVARTVLEGWSGVECLSGIPGLAGATPVQNVGAYGQEVAQTIASVRVYDRTDQQVHTLSADECRFTYRHSLFKGADRYVVLDVLFQLHLSDRSQPIAYADLARQLGVEAGARVPLEAAREGVLAQRRKRGMVLDSTDHDTWSCGSFFQNPIMTVADLAVLRQTAVERLGADGPTPPEFPGGAASLVKTSAAWLIDKAGFTKGYGLPGPAALSTKHTLAVTNRGSATAADVAALAREVRDGVEAAFGVRLVNEPIFVGHDL